MPYYAGIIVLFQVYRASWRFERKEEKKCKKCGKRAKRGCCIRKKENYEAQAHLTSKWRPPLYMWPPPHMKVTPVTCFCGTFHIHTNKEWRLPHSLVTPASTLPRLPLRLPFRTSGFSPSSLPGFSHDPVFLVQPTSPDSTPTMSFPRD